MNLQSRASAVWIRWANGIFLRLVLALLSAGLISTSKADQTKTDSALLSALNGRRFAEAAETANRSLKGRPRDPWLWTIRAMAMEGLDDFRGSLASYDMALRLDAGYVPALKGAAQLTYRNHDKRATQYLSRLLALRPTEKAAHAMLGVLNYEKHNCPQAIFHFQEGGDLAINDEISATEFATCLFEGHRNAAALSVLKQSQVQHPDSLNLRYDIALLELDEGQVDAALASLKPRDDDDAAILSLRASAEAKEGNLNAAFLDMRHAVEKDPTESQNYIDMALFCLDHNQQQRAADVLTVGIEYLPNNPSLFAMRGVAYTELHEFDEAEQDFAHAEQIDPQSAFGKAARATLEMEKQDPERAKEILRRQLKATPNDPIANTALAYVLINQGASPGTPDFDEAQSAITRALRAKPDCVDALVLQGKVCLEENKLNAARAALEEANRLDPDKSTILSQLILIYRRMGASDDADRVARHLRDLFRARFQFIQQTARTMQAGSAK